MEKSERLVLKNKLFSQKEGKEKYPLVARENNLFSF